MKRREMVIEEMARAGYERMFDTKWEELHPKSIEAALWREVAEVMLTELQKVWEEAKRR